MLRVILNNTVHVSAIIKGGPGATKLGDALEAGKFIVIISEPILTEMVDVLRAKGADEQRIRFLEQTLRAYGILVEPTEKIYACRDPDDNKFLEAAIAENADYIVTADKDLLSLSPFRGIPIITVRKFLRIIGA